MDGLVTMTPSSASGLISISPDVDAGDDDTQPSFVKVNDNGGVDFQNVAKLSLDGVFKSGDDGFDNYLIIYRAKGNVRESGQGFRLRASGVDNMDMNYVRQYLEGNAGNVNGLRQGPGSNWSNLTYASFSTAYSGTALYLYGPSLAQPTAVRGVHMAALDGAYILDSAGTHSAGTRFDGFTINTTNDSITGNLIVMGYAE